MKKTKYLLNAMPIVNSISPPEKSLKPYDSSPLNSYLLELFNLNFKFEKNLLYLTDATLKNLDILHQVNLFLEDLNLVNLKGYVKTKDEPNSIFPKINNFFNSLDLIGSIATSERRFQLWINFLIVNLYYILLLKEKELKNEPQFEDYRADLQNLIQLLYSRLDPAIRIKLQKRGISVIQNIYTGYDTEYVLEDVNKHLNKLLSVQLALNTRTILKIPLNNPFEISYVHPLTSSIFTFYKKPLFNINSPELENDLGDSATADNSKSKVKYIRRIELEILENSIKHTIDLIRTLKYSNYDTFLLELTERLKESEGITYYEEEIKDQIVFLLPRTPILQKIIYTDENPQFDFKFENLVKTSNSLANPSLIESYSKLIKDLKSTMPSYNFTLNQNVKGREIIKSRQRTTFKITPTPESTEKISLSRIKNNYFCAHLTNADLSILPDFPNLKDQLDIVQKSFITLGKPLKIDNSSVYIRDTLLLAPAGKRSLESLGKLYNCNKKDLPPEDKENMEKLLKRDRQRFEEYALQDAYITLIHALSMEDFNINLNHFGIPITLSSLGRKYVLHKWRETEYKKLFRYGGYQVSNDLLIGQSEAVQTPKGLYDIGAIGLYLSYYIANYKGGRNESFMYGVDNHTIWYDYDLISAYTTAMADLNLPVYSSATILKDSSIEDWDLEKYLNNYIIIKGTFEFPKETKYPSIPCYLDGAGTVTVYPLNGKCFLTGAEYFLAKLQGCKIIIETIVNTPFKTETTRISNIKIVDILKPFYSIIKELQSLRREYPKGDIMNLLYKEMGNSIYGNVVRGIANKRKFDIKTGRNQRIESTELSNPLLASKTTGFIRSVIGECLHNISRIGGKVVSATTDGFITDIQDLENKLLNLKSEETPLFRKYRELRQSLSGDSTSLEIKHSGKGIISWTTRGQLGIESKIKATTGFQSKGYTQEELIGKFKEFLGSPEKQFEYTQSSLRGANEIYKKGGHVTMKYRDQIFRLLYDNRREIIDEKSNSYDISKKLLDSKPLCNASECSRIRLISKIQRSSTYNKNTSKRIGNVYKRQLEIAVKNFIKGYLNKEPLFGLKGTEFLNYKDIADFIQGYEPAKNILMTPQAISNLKHRKMIFKPVLKTEDTLGFINYVKIKFETFKEDDFFK